MKNKQYLFSIDFWKATAHRALWTGAQIALATIGAAKVLNDFDVKYILSATATAMILSVLKSAVVGVPEVEE